MDKLKALLEHYELDKYLGDLMTMGVFSIEDLCKLHDEDVFEILGSEENPDYERLANLISTVARRYKKDEPQTATEHVVVQPAVSNEDAKEVSNTVHEPEQETISGRTLLGFAAIALGLVLLFVGYNKEKLYFDNMLMYFIGFIVSSFVGAYLVKKELVSTPKNLCFASALTVTAFSLFYFLCEACYRGRLDRFDLNYVDVGPTVFLVASIVVTCILGWKFYMADSTGDTSISTDTKRIHWNTEIGGYKYRFAWFVAYISMPCSVLFNAIMFFSMFDSYEPDGLSLCLFGGCAVFSLIATCGLFRFKHYGYVCVVFNYVIGILFEFLIVIGQIAIYNEYSGYYRYQSARDAARNSIISGCISIFISILCWVYFNHRKDSFNN